MGVVRVRCSMRWYYLLSNGYTSRSAQSWAQNYCLSVNKMFAAIKCSMWYKHTSLDTGVMTEEFVVCARLRNTAQTDFVQCVCWNPVSYELASCSWDGTLQCRAVTDHCVTSDNVTMNNHWHCQHCCDSWLTVRLILLLLLYSSHTRHYCATVTTTQWWATN